MSKLHSQQNGAISIVVAFLMILIIGFLGLSVDFGYAFLQKTRLQGVADSEALACAINPVNAICPNVGADVYPAVNPYNFIIKINNPGDSSLCPIPELQNKCTTATASTTWNTFFINLFGISSLTLSANATSGYASHNPCMLSLSDFGVGLELKGSASVNTINCGLSINQIGTSISLVGSGSITAFPINIMGQVSKSGSGFISTVTKVALPVVDPFLNQLPPTFLIPPPSSCISAHLLKYTGSNTVVVNSGNYCGGISKVGSGSITFNPGYYAGISTNGSGLVKFNPGNYVIYGGGLTLGGSGDVDFGTGSYVIYGGGVKITGSGNVLGNEITIYNSGNSIYPEGGFDITGSVGFNLSAPLSGTLQGILFFQPASNASPVNVAGSGGSILNGNLYLPTASLSISGSANATLPVGVIIASNIKINGSGNISVTNEFTPNGGTSVSKPILVN